MINEKPALILMAQCRKAVETVKEQLNQPLEMYLESNRGCTEQDIILAIEDASESLKKRLFAALRIEQYPRTFKEWMKSAIANGTLKLPAIIEMDEKKFRELIPACELMRLYEQYKEEIWDKLEQWKENNGEFNIISLLNNFRRLHIESDQDLQCLLVCIMCDYIAGEILEEGDIA